MNHAVYAGSGKAQRERERERVDKKLQALQKKLEYEIVAHSVLLMVKLMVAWHDGDGKVSPHSICYFRYETLRSARA